MRVDGHGRGGKVSTHSITDHEKGREQPKAHRPRKKKGTSLIPHGKGKEGENDGLLEDGPPNILIFYSFMRLHLPHFFQKENNSNFGIGKARVFGFLGNRPAGVL